MALLAGKPFMERRGKSRKEAFDPTRSLTSPWRQLWVVLWNTWTMYGTGMKAQVIGEMKRNWLDILGVSEVSWLGKYVALTGETQVGRMGSIDKGWV